MKKRFMLLFVIAALAATLTACGGDKNADTSASPSPDIAGSSAPITGSKGEVPAAVNSEDGVQTSAPESEATEAPKIELNADGTFKSEEDAQRANNEASHRTVVTDESIEKGVPVAVDGPTLTASQYEAKITNEYIGLNAEKSDCLIVTFSFTNKSSDWTTFDAVMQATAKQHGAELPNIPGVFINTDDGQTDVTANATMPVEPGASIDVSKAFRLTDTTDVEITVEDKYNAGEGSVVTHTYKFN